MGTSVSPCRAVIDEGHDVEVILPKFDCMDHGMIDGLRRVDQFKHANVVWPGR
jgi:starch synthase